VSLVGFRVLGFVGARAEISIINETLHLNSLSNCLSPTYIPPDDGYALPRRLLLLPRAAGRARPLPSECLVEEDTRESHH
jgi:hypothetical protein